LRKEKGEKEAEKRKRKDRNMQIRDLERRR
jgi:hypothetical protein